MEPNVGQKYFGIRTENWHRFEIGAREAVPDYLRRVRAELANLELAARVQWNGRRIWGTHVYPGGCWICDTYGLLHGVMGLLEESFPGEREDINTGKVLTQEQESMTLDKDSV